jgi:hypothetical protein
MARALDIISYNNDFGGLASLNRFTWRDGGEVASEIVIREKNVSPYCVDTASKRLIFVDPRAQIRQRSHRGRIGLVFVVTAALLIRPGNLIHPWS